MCRLHIYCYLLQICLIFYIVSLRQMIVCHYHTLNLKLCLGFILYFNLYIFTIVSSKHQWLGAKLALEGISYSCRALALEYHFSYTIIMLFHYLINLMIQTSCNACTFLKFCLLSCICSLYQILFSSINEKPKQEFYNLKKIFYILILIFQYALYIFIGLNAEVLHQGIYGLHFSQANLMEYQSYEHIFMSMMMDLSQSENHNFYQSHGTAIMQAELKIFMVLQVYDWV